MFFKRSQFRVSFEIQAVTIQAFVSWIFQFTCGSVFQFFFVFFFAILSMNSIQKKRKTLSFGWQLVTTWGLFYLHFRLRNGSISLQFQFFRIWFPAVMSGRENKKGNGITISYRTNDHHALIWELQCDVTFRKWHIRLSSKHNNLFSMWCDKITLLCHIKGTSKFKIIHNRMIVVLSF